MTELMIEGYASLFDCADLSGDVVQKGAFAHSLSRNGVAHIACLLGHQDQDIIGQWHEIFEDETGLYVKGVLKGEGPQARRARSSCQKGQLNGLSIGFQTRKSRKRASQGGRILIEIDLWEVSLVTFPMQPLARLHVIEDQGPNQAPSAHTQAVCLSIFDQAPSFPTRSSL